jgi:hypothetical protein
MPIIFSHRCFATDILEARHLLGEILRNAVALNEGQFHLLLYDADPVLLLLGRHQFNELNCGRLERTATSRRHGPGHTDYLHCMSGSPWPGGFLTGLAAPDHSHRE